MSQPDVQANLVIQPVLSSSTTAATDAATDLDALTWQAICGWPEHSGIEVVREGLDYGALTRYFLWDKVPRAMRHRIDPGGFAFEQRLIDQDQQKAAALLPYPKWKQQIKRPVDSLSRWVSESSLRLSRFTDARPVLFVPRQHGSLRSTLAALAKKSDLRLMGPMAHGENPSVARFQVWRQPSADSDLDDLDFSEQLYQGIRRGLRAFDIELLLADRQPLQQQLRQQASLVRQIEAELAIARPQAMLVFADNHTPLQEYVAVAKRANIPTLVIQHCLDCERYCLNEAYADVIAVWGKARQQRYRTESVQQPRLEVTGNPEYDGLRLPRQLHQGKDRWLWATRPHGPHKCYLPSRSPQEGLDILDALLTALEQIASAQLTIKPHPLDYVGLYSEQIEQRGLSDRVTVTHRPLQTCLPNTDIVISEDSTAAVEAMFFGRPVVHAHFAPSPPVLPLAPYQAALPAHNAKTLLAALQQTQSMDKTARKTMLNGQQRFVYDYIGQLDGQATQRVTDLIEQIILNAV